MGLGNQHTTSYSVDRSTFLWLVLPAVVTSLGWGLRGYIGGGPLGAMIPGTLLAFVVCQNLALPARAAATVTAFSAIGLGFGGEMTYGQTLGLLRSGETFWWGLLGTTLKGAVWGLLGGATIGLGLVVHRLSTKSLLLALLCLLIGVIIGLHFINQPKLVYFSNPVDRPRDESWAGFLLGSIALVGYLRLREPGSSGVAANFAGYGAGGGAIGFGAGSLFLALQPHLPDAWRWLPCWKFMEFFFGALLGAALGIAARTLQASLAPRIDSSQVPPAHNRRFARPLGVAVGGLLVAGVFLGWFGELLPLEANWQSDALGDPRRAIARTLLGYTGLGCVLLVLSHRQDLIAWHTAVSVTIVAAAIDWQRDLLPRGEIELAASYRALFVVSVAAVSITFVSIWRANRRPRLVSLAVFTTCVLMGIGYLMAVARWDLWAPPSEQVAMAGGLLKYLWQVFRSEVVVHGIFTTLLVISLAGMIRQARPRAAAE